MDECRLFFKIDLLTDFAALCLTDFIDWRYLHSVVCIFDPACELLPPWMKELYLCTVAQGWAKLVLNLTFSKRKALVF